MRITLIITSLILLGVGCSTVPPSTSPLSIRGVGGLGAVVFPIENYETGRTFKSFGEYIQDRFRGYHTGEDIEIALEDRDREISVVSIADGVIKEKRKTSGYGGVVVVEHTIGGTTVRAIYGHLDLGSVGKNVGESLEMGESIGNLGNHESVETDGERKHLHFALHRGAGETIAGYVSAPEDLTEWINPHDFFAENDLQPTSPPREFDPATDRGGEAFPIRFTIPAGFEVEYVPEIQSLNLFTLSGAGTARDRSQIFIRYFDADRFLTLGTVTVHNTEDLTVNGHDARRYDIEKKPEVADFPFQPAFRNGRHTVTDIRTGPGRTRFYVIAANPSVQPEVIDPFLQSTRL